MFTYANMLDFLAWVRRNYPDAFEDLIRSEVPQYLESELRIELDTRD